MLVKGATGDDICVIIDSSNGLAHVQCQAISQKNADFFGPLGSNFIKIVCKMQKIIQWIYN